MIISVLWGKRGQNGMRYIIKCIICNCFRNHCSVWKPRKMFRSHTFQTDMLWPMQSSKLLRSVSKNWQSRWNSFSQWVINSVHTFANSIEASISFYFPLILLNHLFDYCLKYSPHIEYSDEQVEQTSNIEQNVHKKINSNERMNKILRKNRTNERSYFWCSFTAQIMRQSNEYKEREQCSAIRTSEKKRWLSLSVSLIPHASTHSFH